MSAPDPATAVVGRPDYWLVRANDQLDLRVEPVDLTLEPSGTGYVLRPGVAGGYLIVRLPSQHVLESANTSTTETKGQTPAFGNETTLVFEVDKTTPAIPFTIEGILAALPALSLAVDSQAGATSPLPAPVMGEPAAAILAATAQRRQAAARTPAAQPADEPSSGPVDERTRRADARLRAERAVVAKPSAPAADAAGRAVFRRNTSLRLPSRLELTPRGGATAFSHAATAVTKDGRTELWHTRLAQWRADGRMVEVPADLIALATHELDDPRPPEWAQQVGKRLDGALTRTVRESLVEQTKTRPLRAEQLMLSGLGAWLDAERDFRSNDKLQSYRHRMAMGRDLMVRSVRRGRLYPLGHEAMLTTTTVRQFDPDNGQLAKLVTQWVVTVQEPLRNFGDSSPAERGWPWRSVRLLTTVTPSGEARAFASGAILLHVGGTAFKFRCLGVDRGGRTSTFQLPLIFVEDGKDLGPVATAYRNLHPAFRTAAMAGQTVSVAQPSTEAPEATDVVADAIVINLHAEQTASGTTVRATTDSILGKLPSLQRFVPGLADTPLALNYASAYLSKGFSSSGNAGQLVLQLAGNQSVQLLNLADKAVTGGLATPAFSMNAVSRLTGPVGGDLAKLATGKVKVADLLKQTVGDVKLLGVFRLVDLVGANLELELAGTNPTRRVPQLVTEAIDGISLPRFHWAVDLFKGPGTDPVNGVPAPADSSADIGPVRGSLAALGDSAKLIIDVTTELEQPLNPTAPKVHTRATCRVENVKLTMGAFGQKLVVVPFKHLMFESVDCKKPDFDVALENIEFFGVLAFVRTLTALIPTDAFHDPPALDITDEKISSSFSLPVPAAAVGIFSLENITFSAALDLWFAKPPELSLNFATFDNRFRLAVLCLGGGGYLGVALSTRGLERLDGALEFGAAVSVHLGVARGSVSVMGGIHFAYDRQIGPVLSGYLEVRGEVEVLCLVEVGVSLLVVLAYNFQTGELSGRAELEAHVKVLFFKKTVKVPFSYTFVGGSNGDGAAAQRTLAGAAPAGLPGFLDQMAPQSWPPNQQRPWDAYCLAFA